MYNNPYISNNYNPQPTIDRINAQMSELESMKQQIAQRQSQQPAINQTFQLASPSNIKYANTLEEVNKEYVASETPFFTKDFSQMWLKNPNGNIKIYALEEVVQKDEKDLLIESLQFQVEQLRKEANKNAKPDGEYIDATNQGSKSTRVSINKTNARKPK